MSRKDYQLILEDGRVVEVTNVPNRDHGPRHIDQGARGHAIFIAREAGIKGKIVAVNKLR